MEYRELVKSLRRLYKEKHLITEEKIQELFNDGTITQEEYNYITE